MWHLSPSGAAQEEERPGFGKGWSLLKHLVSVWQQQSAATEQQDRTLERVCRFLFFYLTSYFYFINHPFVTASNPNRKDAHKQCRWAPPRHHRAIRHQQKAFKQQ